MLPVNQIKNAQLLNVYIEKSLYNASIIKDGSAFYFQDNSSFSVEIATIDFSENATDFTYQYKLEPIQNNWTSTSSKAITFNSLLPASYQLRIKVNKVEKVLNFTIKPLWWQTSLFRILSIIVGISVLIYGIWLFVQWSSKKKRENFSRTAIY